MSLSEDLRSSVGPLWEKTVAHPFVIEMGEGTLPEEKFDVYFQQDHLFLRDWISLMCGGIIKAPDFDAARPLAAFVHGALEGEEGLFQQYFRDSGLTPQAVREIKPLPTCLAYSGYLRRMAAEGTFTEIITTLLGIEWPYLDWAKRLESAGKRPSNKYYQTWIDIHAGKELEDFVAWMRRVVDNADPDEAGKMEQIFLDILRYEYLFWEMAYQGETWPV